MGSYEKGPIFQHSLHIFYPAKIVCNILSYTSEVAKKEIIQLRVEIVRYYNKKRSNR
jgi:hypothetical protein